MSIQFGYACLALGVPGTEMRTCMLRTASPEKLREMIAHNLQALERLVDYNSEMGIRVFRITSDLIPFGSSPVNTLNWQNEFQADFSRIGEKIAKAGMRVSMHPGQYTVLNSPDPEVVQRAAADLEYHENILHLLGTDCSSKLILHVGGAYGDREAAVARFIENWPKLSEFVRSRIVLENDERSYEIAEVLRLAVHLGIPAVFDTLHHAIHPPQGNEPPRFWMEQCAKTWKSADGRQKIHYSQQEPGGRPGAHSHTIRTWEFLDFYEEINGLNLDVMLEVKDKNQSAIKCMLLTEQGRPAVLLEREWARYKYLVLEHSHSDYLTIRELLQGQSENSAEHFYTVLEHALSQPSQPGDAINAAQHVWGYFKNSTQQSEKKKFLSALERFQNGKASIQPVKNFLYRLAQQQEQQYLLNSYYFL